MFGHFYLHCRSILSSVPTLNSSRSLCPPPVKWQGALTCEKWDCNCTFTRQRGCCCAANDMFHVEEETFTRIHNLWHSISSLNDQVHELTGKHAAFRQTDLSRQDVFLLISLSYLQTESEFPSKPPWIQMLPSKCPNRQSVVSALSIPMCQFPTQWSL